MINKVAVGWVNLLIVFSSIVIIVEIALIVTGITIYVDDDYGSEDATHKKTIVSAMENASNGDTIFVYNGKYEGDESGWIVIDKSVDIIGQSIDNTVM